MSALTVGDRVAGCSPIDEAGAHPTGAGTIQRIDQGVALVAYDLTGLTWVPLDALRRAPP